MDNRNNMYAEQLSKLIQMETISSDQQRDKTKFYEFQNFLKQNYLFRIDDIHFSLTIL